VTLIALKPTKLLVWEQKRLEEIVGSSPQMKAAAVTCVTSDLNMKLKHRAHAAVLQTYKEMLTMALADGWTSAEERK
jgi:hypothetical protein